MLRGLRILAIAIVIALIGATALQFAGPPDGHALGSYDVEVSVLLLDLQTGQPVTDAVVLALPDYLEGDTLSMHFGMASDDEKGLAAEIFGGGVPDSFGKVVLTATLWWCVPIGDAAPDLKSWDAGAIVIERRDRAPKVVRWSEGSWSFLPVDLEDLPDARIDLGRIYLN